MVNQIFSEQFYTRSLVNGERIGLTEDNRFEILPPESLCNRLKRFFTFQQDPQIDRVHNRFKEILEQVDRGEGPDFQTVINEIHDHGHVKYKRLESNFVNLRKKLDNIGHITIWSEIILKVVNAVRHLFGLAAIQLITYARYIVEEGWLVGVDPSFQFYGNRSSLESEGLKLKETDRNTCHFSADPQQFSDIIQKQEKGLMGFWHISQEHKNYNSPGMVTTQIFASLGIDFDSQQECFLATINNPRVGTQKISPIFSRYLRELPEEERTFRYFVTAANHEQNTTNHVLSWIAQPTEQGSFALNRGPSLVLEPGVVYTFYNDQHQELLSFKIALNEQNIVN